MHPNFEEASENAWKVSPNFIIKSFSLLAIILRQCAADPQSNSFSILSWNSVVNLKSSESCASSESVYRSSCISNHFHITFEAASWSSSRSSQQRWVKGRNNDESFNWKLFSQNWKTTENLIKLEFQDRNHSRLRSFQTILMKTILVIEIFN